MEKDKAPVLARSEQGFVDGLWEHLAAAIDPWAERRLVSFVRRHNANKWIIATDFCIRDASRPNDSFAFVILPAGERLMQTEALLRSLPNRDLKDVKRIPSAMKDALRKGNAFTFCFLADRHRRLYQDAGAARRSLDSTISMMELWKNVEQCRAVVDKFRAIRAEAAKANVNLRLLEDLTVTAALAACLVALLCRHGVVERVAWVPDRDRITDCYSGAAATLFSVNVSALCQRWKLREPMLDIFTQTNDNLWCDPFIRLADYVAGVAAWDPPVADRVVPKIAELIKEVFADNRNMLIFRMAFHTTDDVCPIEIRRLAISATAPPKGKPKGEPLVPLRGRSRDLG